MRVLPWLFACLFLICLPVVASDSGINQLGRDLRTLCPDSPQGKVGFLLTDLLTGESVGFHENEPVNPASVIKISVMVEAYIQASRGRFSFSDKIPLKQSHKVFGAGPLYGQPNGKRFSIQYLVENMIHFSDNTATKMLIDYLGKDNLNGSMRSLGLKNTMVGNSDLLKAQGLNFSTPKDINVLLFKISKGQIVSPRASREMLMILSQQKYRWGVPKPVAKGVLAANKTGTLNGIKHDCGVVFVKGSPYVLTVFTSDFRSVSMAMQTVYKLSELTYQWAVARSTLSGL